MVLDDDSSVRVLLTSILVRDRHDVIESPDGRLCVVFTCARDKPDYDLAGSLCCPNYNGLDILTEAQVL